MKAYNVPDGAPERGGTPVEVEEGGGTSVKVEVRVGVDPICRANSELISGPWMVDACTTNIPIKPGMPIPSRRPRVKMEWRRFLYIMITYPL